MKIYVTGESGFIGSAFRTLAVRRGHVVSGMGRARLENPPWEAIKRFAPDACLHTAWIANPGQYLTAEINRDYANWSIAFLRQMCALGTRHLVALGTCVEYAPSSAPLREGASPLGPTSPYAVSKDRVRQAMEADAGEGNCTFAWARIFYPYGVGEHPRRLSSIIAKSLMEDREVVLNTPASVKDYIYIDDVASALLAIAERGYNGPVNVGSGTGSEVRAIAATLAQLVGKSHLVREPDVASPDEYPFVVADTSVLRGLGWRPDVSLRDGLQKLIEALS